MQSILNCKSDSKLFICFFKIMQSVHFSKVQNYARIKMMLSSNWQQSIQEMVKIFPRLTIQKSLQSQGWVCPSSPPLTWEYKQSSPCLSTLYTYIASQLLKIRLGRSSIVTKGSLRPSTVGSLPAAQRLFCWLSISRWRGCQWWWVENHALHHH